MRRLFLFLLASTTLAQSGAIQQRDYVAHIQSAYALLQKSDYSGAVAEFRHALEIRPESPPALTGLIRAYALSSDIADRDAAIRHLRAMIKTGEVPRDISFVRERLAAAGNIIVVSEFPIVTLSRQRYAFDVVDAQQRPRRLELMSREQDQSAGGPRRFSLIANDTAVRTYDRGEPAYEQVVADVKAFLAGQTPSAAAYALAKNPAVVDPIPITVEDPSDPRLPLQAGQIAIEYIAHSCFRIHTPAGTRLLIDPFASRMWIGYDFPSKLAADAVLITHPHYDHDADVLIGMKPPPWAPNVPVFRDPGPIRISDATITGIRGKHADPWGKEFGQTNTIWLIEAGGLRIAHLGDNGPLTDANLQELGRVDIVMMAIDAKHHILSDPEIEAIRKALHPRIVIPMHYRIPDLEPSPDTPEGLGEIGPWLGGQQNVVKLESNVATFTAASLLPAQMIVVFPHSPKVATSASRR